MDYGNFMLDYEEAVQYLLIRNKIIIMDNIQPGWFSLMDTNKDNFLTFDEIDSLE